MITIKRKKKCYVQKILQDGGGGKVSIVARLAYSKNDALQNSATHNRL